MLNVQALEYRRLETDMTMVYKLIHKLQKVDLLKIFNILTGLAHCYAFQSEVTQ